jgi:hypothetical protein
MHMDLAYALPGVVALIEWLLATVLYVYGWYQTESDLNRFGDSLRLAGLITGLGGALWLVWDGPYSPTLIQSSLATGLAASTLVVYDLLARRRLERLSAAATLGFVILMQLFAVGQLLFEWGPKAGLPTVFLPLGMALGTLTGLAGYGGLVVSVAMILVCFTLNRMEDSLDEDQLQASRGLSVLEWKSWQIALVALSISLSIELTRSWWGLGQVVVGGMRGVLITWLLLAAGAYGLTLGITPRLARVLLVLAGAVAVISVLIMGTYLTGTGPLAGTG